MSNIACIRHSTWLSSCQRPVSSFLTPISTVTISYQSITMPLLNIGILLFMQCLILLSFGLTVSYVTTSPFRRPPLRPALYHHCHQLLCRKPRHVHSHLAHSLPGRTSQAARRSSTSGAPCGIRIFLLPSCV